MPWNVLYQSNLYKTAKEYKFVNIGTVAIVNRDFYLIQMAFAITVCRMDISSS